MIEIIIAAVVIGGASFFIIKLANALFGFGDIWAQAHRAGGKIAGEAARRGRR